jgi:small conductance mechanosensitive channel
MDWSGYLIDVAVAYKEDTDRVTDIMRQVADAMRAEAEFRPLMLEPIEIFGVDNFTDAAVTLKARFKTQPSQQLTVGREYRRRLKKAFDDAGVEMAPALRAAAARTVPAPPSP